MIQSAITPRRFAWSGGLALLCLTAILLPASRAQNKADDKKAEEKQEIRSLKLDFKKQEDEVARVQEDLQRKLAALQAELQAKKAEAEKLAAAMQKLQVDAERKVRAEVEAKTEALKRRQMAEAEAQRAHAVQAALKAEMAAKAQAAQAAKKEIDEAVAAKYRVVQKEAQAPKEDDKDARAKEIKDLQMKLEALIRERDRLSKVAPAPATGTIYAKRVVAPPADNIKGEVKTHIIVLEQNGKHLMELPSEVIVAERNGKLIIEIPLAGIETRKTATPPAVVPPPAGAKGTPPPVMGTFILKDGTVFSSEAMKGWKVEGDLTSGQHSFKIVGPGTPPSAEDRLGSLEKKLAEVLKELEGLRKEMKSKDSKGKTGTATMSADGLFLKLELEHEGEKTFVMPVPGKVFESPKVPAPPTPVKPKEVSKPAPPAAPKPPVAVDPTRE